MPKAKIKAMSPVAGASKKNTPPKPAAPKASPRSAHDHLRQVYQENGFIGSSDQRRIDRPGRIDRPAPVYRNHPGLIAAAVILAVALAIALAYIFLPFPGINRETADLNGADNAGAAETAGRQSQTPTSTAPEEPADPLANWVTYNDASKAFEFKYSPAWKADQPDPELVNFELSGLPETVITANWQATSTDLNKYLLALDKINATSWEGKPAVEVQRQGNVKIGSLDAYQRWQKLLAADLEQIVTYIPVGNKIYSLAIRSPRLDDQMIQTYGLFLATFQANKPSSTPVLASSTPIKR